MSTSSDEACKHFDSVVTQYVGWYEDDSVGGVKNSTNMMIEADPHFVLGHVLKNGMVLSSLSKSIYNCDSLRESMDTLERLAKEQVISKRERNHVTAIKLWAEGFLKDACSVWENIIIEYPKDILAIKFAHDCYFCLSHHQQMRDSISRVLPFWDKSMPLYGYLLGMHAFGLEECHLYDAARQQATKALEINRYDAWATHALAHVHEMTGQHEAGIKFMRDTESDWKRCEMTVCHNYWHLGLFHIEKGEFEEALEIYDKEIVKRALKSKSTMGVVNSISYLNRLNIEGLKLGKKFYDLNEISSCHIDDHIIGFNDANFLLANLRADDRVASQKLIESIQDFIRNGTGDNRDVMKSVGADVCKALVLYVDGQYSAAVNLLLPKKYEIIRMGGSNAQRDMFNLILIDAATKSEQRIHHQLAKMLISERKALKENSPLNGRLENRLHIVTEHSTSRM